MLKLGIIGTGRIARRFVLEAAKMPDISVEVIYNPHRKSAECFARELNVPLCSHSLEEFAGHVEAVYVASPHETHYKYTRQMLSLGIHVLCEKPLALSGQDAKALFELAEKKGCILMEAIKTAYCPGYQAIIESAESGIIGKIRDVEACFSRLTPTNTRELKDRMVGGSFTELGSYSMLPVLQVLGTEYDKIYFHSLAAANGLDAYTKTEFIYKNAFALAKTGLLVKSEGQLVIAGTKGYILAKSPWWLTKEFEVRFEDPAKIEVHNFEYKGTGLCYEIEAFLKTIRGNDAMKVQPEVSIRMADVIGRFLKERNQKENRNMSARPFLKIWAHRGMSYAYPENTLKAFEAAAKLPGLTGIAFDVQLTKDGEVVVIHDESVNRTSEGCGLVKEYTLEEIKKLNDDEFKIPTLRESLMLLRFYCMETGLLINIEMKNSTERYEGLEEKVLDIVEELGLGKYVWYSSFSPESLEKIKSLQPEAKTGILARTLEDCVDYAAAVKADALHPNINGLNAIPPKSMRDMPIRAWNSEEPFWGQDRTPGKMSLQSYADFGVTDVFTNVPEMYLEEKGKKIIVYQ